MGLFSGELFAPIGIRGIDCIETLFVTAGGDVGLAIPRPPLPLLLNVSEMLSPSASSCTVSGVVASLCSLAYLGRWLGGLEGGETCGGGLKTRACEVDVKPSDGSAGVLVAVSDRSEDSLMRGRRSAISRMPSVSRRLRPQPLLLSALLAWWQGWNGSPCVLLCGEVQCPTDSAQKRGSTGRGKELPASKKLEEDEKFRKRMLLP